MDATANLERQFKELESRNQANETENIKAKVQLEETIKRIKSILASSDAGISLEIDYERLEDADYVKQIKSNLDSEILSLQNKFNIELQNARRELGE